MFVIVRHGNTFAAGETPRRIGARTDIGLTDAGLAQAASLGQLFAAQGWHFGRALVSPLLRTRATAAAILSELDCQIVPETAEFLCEIDHGPDENQPEHAVLDRIGAHALAAWDTHAAVPPGWLVDSDARLAGWRALFAQRPLAGAPTLLVTSNGAARFALLAEPGLQAAAGQLASLKLPTGGYGIITVSDGGQLDVPVWGARP
jgi:broad specificity phosphatase PhoE